MKRILIIIYYVMLLSGCANIDKFSKSDFLPQNVQQTVMVKFDIYQFNSQGLHFQGHFTPLKNIYDNQNKIWENGGSRWDVNDLVYSKYNNSLYFTSPPIESPNINNANSFISLSDSNLYRLSLSTGKTKLVHKNLSGKIEVSPNGRFLALEVGNPPYKVYSSFAIVDTANDSTKILKQDIQVISFLWFSDHELLIYAYEGDGIYSLSILDVNTLKKRDFYDVYKSLPYHNYMPCSVSPNGDYALFTLEGALSGELWMLNIRQNRVSKLLTDYSYMRNFGVLYWMPNNEGFLFCKRHFDLKGDAEFGSNAIHYYSFINQRENQVTDLIGSRKSMIILPKINNDFIKN